MVKKIVFGLLVFTVLALLFTNKERGNKGDENGVVTDGIPVVESREIKENPLLVKVLGKALSFKGVSYKFGGETKDGLDCSGLVFSAYKEVGMTLARSSRNMYYDGEEVALEEVKKGDLLFFDVDKFEDKVNHVSMVTSVNDFEINFIHSTEKEGVVITSINDSYWKKAFIKAKRIIE